MVHKKKIPKAVLTSGDLAWLARHKSLVSPIGVIEFVGRDFSEVEEANEGFERWGY